MSIVRTNDLNYAGIADAIRIKSGVRAVYTPAQMAAAIEAIPNRLSIPEYWRSKLANAVHSAQLLKLEGGADVVQFVWFSDLHLRASVANANYGRNIGMLAAYLMDACHIPYCLMCGDTATNAAEETAQLMWDDFAYADSKIAPIGLDRLIRVRGNHDGCWGWTLGADGTKENYYGFKFTQEQLKSVLFKPLSANQSYHFASEGSYYYVDDAKQSIRIIALDSFWSGDASAKPDGTANYDSFNHGGYGQAQLDWLCNTALVLPTGYDCIIITHIPPNGDYDSAALCRDNIVLEGIISAFCKRTSYMGTYAFEASRNEGAWANVAINKDFSAYKGRCLGVFSGHCHKDTAALDKLPCPVLTITCAANSSYDAANEGVRSNDSALETALDIVSIDRSTGVINCIRVGIGRNRVVGGSITKYTITNELSHVTTSNGSVSIARGERYSASLTAAKGYTLNDKAISIVMGGADITSAAYGSGNISIASVTGDVVITAAAVRNALDTGVLAQAECYNSTEIYGDGKGYKDGMYLSDNASTYEAPDVERVLTGFIPFAMKRENGVERIPTLYVKGASWKETSHVRFWPFILNSEGKKILLTAGKLSNGAMSSADWIVTQLGDDYYRFQPTAGSALYAPEYHNFTHCRLSLTGTGENLIVTIDREITWE